MSIEVLRRSHERTRTKSAHDADRLRALLRTPKAKCRAQDGKAVSHDDACSVCGVFDCGYVGGGMSDEWFQWQSDSMCTTWVNKQKALHVYVWRSLGEAVFKVMFSKLWEGSRETAMQRIFQTQDEALAFARDFMEKNGGIIK